MRAQQDVDVVVNICHICPKPHEQRFILTSVNDDMFGQVSHVDKRLVAHPTLVWSHIVMMANVIGQLA